MEVERLQKPHHDGGDQYDREGSQRHCCRLTRKERKYRIDTISSILKETKADFVMFSEHVLKSKEDLHTINNNIGQKHVTALFELNESYG